MSTIMRRVVSIVLLFVFSGVCVEARIMNDRQISEFIRGMDQYNNLPNVSLRKDKRTIVLEMYDVDYDVATTITPSQIAACHTDKIVGIFGANFISQRNIYHYTTQQGVPATRVVEASFFDFLGISI